MTCFTMLTCLIGAVVIVETKLKAMSNKEAIEGYCASSSRIQWQKWSKSPFQRTLFCLQWSRAFKLEVFRLPRVCILAVRQNLHVEQGLTMLVCYPSLDLSSFSYHPMFLSSYLRSTNLNGRYHSAFLQT